jgi:hypothetical protein
MAIEPLVATFEDNQLWIRRGDRPVIHQPFRPSIGDEPLREWIDEEDAMAYWESIKEESKLNGLTSEEMTEMQELEQSKE